MQKVKQIMALIGAILLAGLYVTTLVLALTSSPDTMGVFKAAIFCTAVIPTLIWIYTFIFKMIHKKDEDK